MAEFQEVMKQAKRMCKAHDECDNCTLREIADKADIYCPFQVTRKLDIAKVEAAVMDWASEHPEPVYPTWKEWQKANFPDAHDVMHPCAFMKREEVEGARRMTIKKLVAKIEEFQEKNAEECLELQDPEKIAYAEGRGDALRWVLAVIEEG